MENLNEMEHMSLVDELTQGRELAIQLKNQIAHLKSKETCENLFKKIFSSYDKALSRLNLSELLQKDLSPTVGLVQSPESSDGVSPKTRRARDHSPRVVSKKRKTLPCWTKEIKVCSGTEVERSLDDGYSWRKYGQKDILGATHPRAYYRCTHKHTRGCEATRQVQKSEKDPSIFDIIYRGEHICMGASSSPSPVVSLEEKPKDIVTNNLQQQPEPKPKQNIPFIFGQGLKAETEEINPKMITRISSFSFPSTMNQSEHQDIWELFEEDNILDRILSPATSESNHFSASTCQVFPVSYGIRSDLSDMVSTPTSGSNPLYDFSMYPFEVNIEPTLPVEVLDYFTPSV